MKRLFGVLLVCSLAPRAWAGGETWRLAEADVVRRILETHLGIQAAREDADAAAADVRAAKGAFDTTVAAGVDERINKASQPAPAITGTRADATRVAVGLTKTWPTGTETGLHFANARTKVVGSLFMNPLEYEAAVTASVRQPLLKNVGGTVDRSLLAQARAAFRAADTAAQRRAQEALRSGLGFYWQTVFAERDVRIARQAAVAAQAFQAITEGRYQLGTADGADVLAAKATAASRAAGALAAQGELEAALRGLKTDLQLPAEAVVTPLANDPPAGRAPAAEEGAMAMGLANRPDYLAAQHRVTQMRLKLQMARNKKWPSLDLVSSLALNQLATTSYGAALSGTDHPNFFVGLQFQVPIENRRARGERDRAAHEQARALVELKALENQIVHEIVERSRTLTLLAGQVKAQAQAETLQQNRVILEREQYRLGRSSSLQVIKAQDDHLAAQQATVRAQLAHQLAWLDYRLATAQLP